MQDVTSEILNFWFGQTKSPEAQTPQEFWFKSTPEIDNKIRDSFEKIYENAVSGTFNTQATSANDYLAMVILLDQLPRNMFRGSPRAFASDPLALDWAKRAIALGHDHKQPAPHRRMFFYLPYEHSEEIDDQNTCVALMEKLGDAEYLRYAHLHRDVITRFGRFPHRNAILGRTSTPSEETYLEQPGAGF